MVTNSKSIMFFIALGLITLFASWNKPLLSSHNYRQTQTAQTAEILLEPGESILMPKIRFFGRPGYNLLELPVYQWATAQIHHIIGLTIEQSGRLLSWIFALLFVIIAFKVTNILIPEADSILTLAILVSAPLLLGTSQWLSIEPFNLAMATLSLYGFMILMGFTKYRFALGFLIFVVSTNLSFITKPNMIFGILPLYIFVLFQSKRTWTKRLIISICLIPLVVAVPVLWFVHAEGINKIYQNHFGIFGTSGGYFSSIGKIQSASILKLISRYFLYVANPFVVVLAVASLIFLIKSKKPSFIIKKYKSLLITLALCPLIYSVVFLNVNVVHNYYQLGVLFPYSLILLILLMSVETTYGWILKNRTLVLSIVFTISILLSQARLANQDLEWEKAVQFIQNELRNEPKEKDIRLVTNYISAPAVLGFYTKRYLTFEISTGATETVKSWLTNNRTANEIVVIACDDRDPQECRTPAFKAILKCDAIFDNPGFVSVCIKRS